LIESYEFGAIVIKGKKYTSDIIVLPERVIDGWWRKEGHKVHIEDLGEILEQEPKPEVLVLGTGYYGLVEIPPEVRNTLKSYGIEIVAQLTSEACQTFNKTRSSRRVAGAFHLTC